ncbi:MAG: nuclear transport factor 2 family protein [Betaproteobacteria bacterium]|nr:nuclear transport factor 2 family protein [Betaproteobacteria bacterium]
MTTITPALQALMDRSAIIQAIQNWGFFRDDKQWDKLRDLYTADGRMTTTWTIASADEFIHHCRGLASKGGGRKAIHSIGVTTVELNGERALAETRMTLLVRGMLDGVEVDVTNYGRTYDRFVKEQDGVWRIRERVPIYEKDRLDPVDPAAILKLDPASYRHLAYLQSLEGATITPDLPVPNSESLKKLYAAGSAWLAGK